MFLSVTDVYRSLVYDSGGSTGAEHRLEYGVLECKPGRHSYADEGGVHVQTVFIQLKKLYSVVLVSMLILLAWRMDTRPLFRV